MDRNGTVIGRRGDGEFEGGPGWRTMAGAAALYGTVLAGFCWPFLGRLATTLPASLPDPLQHLWILRWYGACLRSGQLPFLAPDVMYPIGAPLGLFSPLHLQAVLFELLGLAVSGDILRYNLIWCAGFLSTAAAGFWLSWRLVGHRVAAVFGGLLCLLATPVTLHATGHLELIYAGMFAFFALAWVEFVDRPTRRTLLAAFGTYVLLSASAAYFAVMATVPACLYVLLRAGAAVRSRRASGLREFAGERWRPFLAFAGLALVALAILLSAQIWAHATGLQAPRGRVEFARYGTPLWSYLAPTPFQRTEELLPWHPYRDAGFGATVIERGSYLGLLPIALIAFAAACRVRLPRAAFWWSTFALSVVLSLGAFASFGPRRISLPADWLWHLFPPMQQLRVPARFNLFAVVVASALAAAGLAALRERIASTGLRRALTVAAFAAVVVDLAPRPFPGASPPPMPEVYRRIVARDPAATFHEAPYFGTRGMLLAAATAYWQFDHGGKTSGGYSGMVNAELEHTIVFPSPFFARSLSFPTYLEDPSRQFFDVVRADAADYVWAFLTRHGYRYAVVYRDRAYFPELDANVERLLELLAPAEVDRDPAAIVYATDRLPKPKRPVLVPGAGFRNRQHWRGLWAVRVGKRAEFALYNPTPGMPIVFGFGASSFLHERTAKVVLATERGERVVHEFKAFPEFRWYDTAPFSAPAGWSTLRIESASESPQDPERAEWGADRRPISLWLSVFTLRTPEEAAGPVRRFRDDDRPGFFEGDLPSAPR